MWDQWDRIAKTMRRKEFLDDMEEDIDIFDVEVGVSDFVLISHRKKKY